MNLLQSISKEIVYSFPIQLFINNIKKNQLLLFFWAIPIAIVVGGFGKYLGMPYLFLDPEYLNQVNFTSFFIMGTVLAGFTMAFHISCYINDGHRFPFVGTMKLPFSRFILNNSIIPLFFLIFYVRQIIFFQINNEYCTRVDLVLYLAGLLSGFGFTSLVYFVYFQLTNKDIFKYLVCRLDEKLKRSVRVTRKGAMKKLDIARKRHLRVDTYFDYDMRFKRIKKNTILFDRQTITKVFDQNHFHLVTIQLFIFFFILLLTFFKDVSFFQIPAAASLMIFLSTFVMVSGALSYWFGTWATTMAIALLLLINYSTDTVFFSRSEKVFGLTYLTPPVNYSIEKLQQLSHPDVIQEAEEKTLQILTVWRKKFPDQYLPKMVFVATSGGGKRAALWALSALQVADSLTQGSFFNHAMLITGASGGLIGASFFRELKLRQSQGVDINPLAAIHRVTIGADNLNPLVFSFLSKGLLAGFTRFDYAGQRYTKNRSFTFEHELNTITGGLLDKPLIAYQKPESQAIIPMLICSPTIVNDGRALYISPQPVGYLNTKNYTFSEHQKSTIAGIDFRKLFSSKQGDSLRFLSALRMNASFPYITPNSTLPTSPTIEITDAGISDNYGLDTTIRFIYAFRKWIEKNTSGVILVSIRDSPKLKIVSEQPTETFVEKLIRPISSVYSNLESFQDIRNELSIQHAASWLTCPIYQINLQYNPSEETSSTKSKQGNNKNITASLSWRLTSVEKKSVMSAIYNPENQMELHSLATLLMPENKTTSETLEK